MNNINDPRTLSDLANVLIPHIIDRLGINYNQSTNSSSSPTPTGGGGSTSVHDLSGLYHRGTLADSQAPQFLLVNGSRQLTGSLAVTPGATLDGVDLSDHVLQPDAHHNRLNKYDGSLDLDFVNQYIGINYAFPFTWTHEHDFTAGLLSSYIGAHTTLTLQPATSISINPGSAVMYFEDGIGMQSRTSVTGFLGAGWRLTNVAGHGFLDIREIQVEELHAYMFTADIERVRVGETFVTPSMAILYADFVIPAIGGTVTIQVEDVPQALGAVFSNNEWVLMQLIDRTGGALVIARYWGQVSGYVDGTGANDGTQFYTYTHRHGTAGATLKKGSLVLDFGLSGSGYIHESVIDAGGSPYTRYATWATDPSVELNRTVHVQIGNLDSISDTTLDPSGWGLYADVAYLRGDLIAAAGLVHITHAGINIQMGDYSSYSFTGGDRSIDWWDNIDDQSGNPLASISAGKNYNTFHPSDDYLILWASPKHLTGAAVKILAGGASAGSAYQAEINVAGQAVDDSSRSGQGSEITLRAVFTGVHGDFGILGDTYARAIKAYTASTYDIGSVGTPFKTLYVDTIVASAVTGGTALSGSVWEYDSGDMYIESNGTANRVLHLVNTGTGVMDLDVERDITLGGLVDGVDLSGLYTAWAAHITNANAHHAQSHVLATTAALGADHTVSALTAGMVLKATGATTALFVQLLHSELGGLTTGDPHTQYVSLSIARTITAVHNFSPSTAIAPFTLAANAQGQTVIGLKADQLNRTVSAGNGMTGGGTLTANITLTLGTPTTLDLTTTNSVTGTTHAHAITTSANPGAAARILASTSAGGLTLQTLSLAGSGTALTTTAGTISIADNTSITAKIGMLWVGDMGYGSVWAGVAHRAMASAGNYALIQSNVGSTIVNAATTQFIYHRIANQDVLAMGLDRLNPAGSGLIALGDYNRKYSQLFASQLIVDVLVASNVMATIGGRILVAPTAQLTRDLAYNATTIYVDSNLAQPLQELYMSALKGGPQSEWFRIISGPVTISSTEWSYVVSRNTANQGNKIPHTNFGFENASTVNWLAMPGGPGVVSFAVDGTDKVRGFYSGKVVTANSPGNYSGIYTEVTLIAGVRYSLSFYAKTSFVATFNVDVFQSGTLDITGIVLAGSNAWARYAVEFVAVASGVHQIRAFDSNTSGGSFWLDEVILEAKFGDTGYGWYTKDAVVNLGYDVGSGYIDLTSLTTIQGHYGPTITTYAHPYAGAQAKPTTSLGNLRSFVDYSYDTMGWAVGNDLTLSPSGGFVGLTGDAVNGLRLFNVIQKFYVSGAEVLRIEPATGITIITGVAHYNKLSWKTAITDSQNFAEIVAYNSGSYGRSLELDVFDGSNTALLRMSADSVYGKGIALQVFGGSTGSSQMGLYGDYAYANGIFFNRLAYGNLANATQSEITNDTTGYARLMVVGNSSAGALRRVGIWDQLSIFDANFLATLNVNGAIYVANFSPSTTPTVGGFIYASAGALWYKGSSGTNTKLANA